MDRSSRLNWERYKHVVLSLEGIDRVIIISGVREKSIAITEGRKGIQS